VDKEKDAEPKSDATGVGQGVNVELSTELDEKLKDLIQNGNQALVNNPLV